MTEPLVSVIVATYKRDEALRKALSSLAVQTYKNIEIVLVDDNGVEDWNQTVENIVTEIQSSFPALNLRKIVNHPNKGSAKARNEGIYSAKGEYITFLDDDDIYLPNKIERQVNYISEKKAELCLTDLFLYNEKDVLTDKRIRNYIKQTDARSLLRYHMMYHLTGTDTLMFSTAFLQKIGGFPPIDVGDEFYLVLKAIENECKFAYLPGCDIKAYIHNENGGLSTGENKIKGENALWKKKSEFFEYLDKKDVRFINMRHYAVLAVANMTAKNYGKAINSLLKSFVSTPVGFVKLFISHKG